MLTLTANGIDASARPACGCLGICRHATATPPNEVPALTPDLKMLEKHRSDAACIECHRRIDPLGFALESFDPIGRERTQDLAEAGGRSSPMPSFRGRDRAKTT